VAAGNGSILLVTIEGGLLVSRDGGHTYRTAYPAAESIDFTSDGVGVAVVGPWENRRLVMTVDGGTSWEARPTEPLDPGSTARG
jgi:hypothetical protein